MLRGIYEMVIIAGIITKGDYERGLMDYNRL